MKDFESKIQKAIAHFIEDLATVRAGRASASVLEKIMVDDYGTPTPVTQVGNVNSPDPRSLVIQPWDQNLVKEIEKAIQKSDLGINPTNDGKVIRLAFPPLTEERRKELVKAVSKKTEDAKIAVRNVRRDAMDALKKQKKDGELTEDDLKDMEKDFQKVVDKAIKEIDDIFVKKDKEIMEI